MYLQNFFIEHVLGTDPFLWSTKIEKNGIVKWQCLLWLIYTTGICSVTIYYIVTCIKCSVSSQKKVHHKMMYTLQKATKKNREREMSCSGNMQPHTVMHHSPHPVTFPSTQQPLAARDKRPKGSSQGNQPSLLWVMGEVDGEALLHLQAIFTQLFPVLRLKGCLPEPLRFLVHTITELSWLCTSSAEFLTSCLQDPQADNCGA